MSERTIRDVMLDDPATCINMGIVGEVLGLLGLDPNVVLDKDCETCTLDDGTRAAVPGDDCPDCDGTGRVEVNRVVVGPPCTCGDRFTDHVAHSAYSPCYHPAQIPDDGTVIGPADQQALRIGRVVLASTPMPDLGFAPAYREGWNHARATLLAAGEDE